MSRWPAPRTEHMERVGPRQRERLAQSHAAFGNESASSSPPASAVPAPARPASCRALTAALTGAQSEVLRVY